MREYLVEAHASYETKGGDMSKKVTVFAPTFSR